MKKEEEDKDEKMDELKKDIEEHRNVVKYLGGKLNEVNLLNPKLCLQMLFRNFGLNNEQKLKVVETFDGNKPKRSQVGIFNFGRIFW